MLAEPSAHVGAGVVADTCSRLWFARPAPAVAYTCRVAPERRSQDPETTTRLLLEAAAAEFIERGYEAARVNDIARRVGVTAGAVYGRWPHKPDVLVAALEHTLEKILPEHELGNLGGADAGSFDKLALLGTNLLAFNPHKDVVTQVFGSARNNEAIRSACWSILTRTPTS